MKNTAIVAEYNPFHKGHKYQIEKIKNNESNVIVIMSSSFTQRGTPAIIDKFTRALIALENGADLVIELPCVFSTSNAEIFAKGAIGILNSMDCIDYLCFGLEDNIKDLVNIKTLIDANKSVSDINIRKYLFMGYSYPVARELSYDFLTFEYKSIIKKPNNILGLEYLRALDFYKSQIKPIHIKRKYASHKSTRAINNFSSSSFIRKEIEKNNFLIIKDLVPQNSYNELISQPKVYLNDFFKIFKYIILKEDINYTDYIDYEKGIEKRFLEFMDSKDIYEFIKKVSSKRYTYSRITRLIIQIVLDLKKDFILSSLSAPYIRILGASENGFSILKVLKEKKITYIDKFVKIKSLDDDSIVKKIALKESFATDLYNNILNKPAGEDYLVSSKIKRT
ncbi:tRNA(Met) cytidine acetate ligase [Peptoniphilus catoniae]|uniref:tRNA(Met) cytidine acetate ligase n=1 Tax=Peptoniphilus catoniae TaxID=1660341 RepID=UPI0010FD8C4C|nr:nucleotidyltransferase family protein [Peptoniphilus catoniae]